MIQYDLSKDKPSKKLSKRIGDKKYFKGKKGNGIYFQKHQDKQVD